MNTEFLKKSKFFDNVDPATLVKKAEIVQPTLQKQTGNLERIIDAGKIIGIDKNTGKPTSLYTVITDTTGNLITIFPGVPTYIGK